jgi:hypothetical protein
MYELIKWVFNDKFIMSDAEGLTLEDIILGYIHCCYMTAEL